MRGKRIRFDPFEEFARAVADNFARMDSEGELDEGVWYPGVDIYEIETGIIIIAELPGVKKENLEISLESDYLVIQGKRYEPVYQFVKCHHRESLYGSFKRSVRIPRKVDTDNIKAELKEGLLLIYLPLTEEPIAKVTID